MHVVGVDLAWGERNPTGLAVVDADGALLHVSAVRTDDEVVQMARVLSGVPDLEVKVINRSVWRLTRQVAANFRRGRVLLARKASSEWIKLP